MKRPETMSRPTEKEVLKGRTDLLERIQDVSLFIGSRAWGVETAKSDWDYLISQEKLNDILLEIEKDHQKCFLWKELYHQSHGDSSDRDRLYEFYSIIIEIDSQVFNIISPVDKANYRAWRSAVNQIKKLDTELIKNKYDRVEIFELFKKIYRNKYKKLPKPSSTRWPR